jgi:HEAT repeat protein
MTESRIRRLLFVFIPVAGIGLLIPGSPAFLPSLWSNYSQFYDGHSLGYWIRSLDRTDPSKRNRAIRALGAIGADAAAAVPGLASVLTEDPDEENRRQAALSLAKIAPASAEAVPALARALVEDSVAGVRMNAAIALGRLKTQAHPAVPALIKAIKNKANQTNLDTFTFTIQEMSALALAWATADTSEGVAPLIEILQSARGENQRLLLARALGEIGPPARSAEPQLRKLLNDDSAAVRGAAAAALRNIGEK